MEKIRKLKNWGILVEPEDLVLWTNARTLSQITPYLDVKDHPVVKSLRSIPHTDPLDRLAVARDLLCELLHSEPDLILNLLLTKLLPDIS